jgi:hypothetical protein
LGDADQNPKGAPCKKKTLTSRMTKFTDTSRVVNDLSRRQSFSNIMNLKRHETVLLARNVDDRLARKCINMHPEADG